MDLTWLAARHLAARTGPVDFDWEEANEKKAQAMARALRQALGKEGGKNPEVLARALDIYDSRLMDRLVDWWGSQADDEDEGEPEPEPKAATSDF